jgi:hypothetical protein
MTRKNDISTPEGYFDELQNRLSMIAVPAAPASTLRRFSPYFAYAAFLALAVVLGGVLLRNTAVSAEEEGGSWQYLAYHSQSMDPDGWVESDNTLQLSEEDIVNYLIDNGTSIDYLNAVRYEEVY